MSKFLQLLTLFLVYLCTSNLTWSEVEFWGTCVSINIMDVCYLRNRKHVPCFYRVIETWVKFNENEKRCGNKSHRRVFPQLFWVLPNFQCFYNFNLIETQSMFSIFLQNNAPKKQKNNFYHQNVNSLCWCHHCVNSSC